MIPNGKEINWNGHKLRFESESYPCRGCFFEDKDECPECDEGLWVEDSHWHTGTPTEEGLYLVKLKEANLYETHNFTGNNWCEHFEKWQKIEER